MCGFNGIAATAQVTEPDWLLAGRETMAHRGPDDAGLWWSDDRQVGLAHRRLSIIDLSEAGHQPMSEATDRYRIVFNGEIYNHQDLRRELQHLGSTFRSRSDTEVVLNAYLHWGEACLERLNGMFALALYDTQERSLLLARDRAGEKPLFYHHTDGALRFGSELKALLTDPNLPRCFDPVALDCYLAMGFVPGDRCLLAGFSKLPPAHALRFDVADGRLRIWRYWQLPDWDEASAAGPADEPELLTELEDLLANAVARQIVADVPVGVLLSGGVDSSLITALAVRTSSQVKTFTVRFSGHGRYDETEHARLIARRFGTEHIELEAGSARVAHLRELARQFDEPIVDSSMLPTYLLSRLVSDHCKVVLGGDGGDELFGGYSHYNRLLWLQQRLGWLPLPLRRTVAGLGKRLLPTGFKGRNWLQALGTDLSHSVPLVATYFDAAARRRLLAPVDRTWPCPADAVIAGLVPSAAGLLQRATRLDFHTYLAEDILVKVDRASMLNSLEVRAPLLDHRVIEFAFGRIPADMKASATRRKILLKKLAARLLPVEFDLQRKQGFSIPLATWLKTGEFRDFFHTVLLEGETLFDRSVMRDLLAGQDRGQANSERLFALVLLESWRRIYGVSL